MAKVFELNHPLVKQKLTLLRDKETKYKPFRELAKEITILVAYEAMKGLEVSEVDVETPLAKTTGYKIKNDIVIVPVLRAGVGMLDGVLNLAPKSKVGFVGMYRDSRTKEPIAYYEKLPENLNDPFFFVIDPMVATGGSLIATIDLIKKYGHKKISIISILAAPEGIKAVHDAHPDVTIFTGVVDQCLNEKKYIVPGLGDAGDRLFGTK